MDDVKIGFCQCCGKSVKLINPKGKKQSEWDTIATDMCDCQKKGRKIMHKEKLTLATICGGEVQRKVDRALEQVARNILDPNVVPDKKRTVTLKITLKPSDEDPEDVIVSADVTCTEIKGQLDFSDVGIGIEEEFDPETGEIIQGDVLNFRQANEG